MKMFLDSADVDQIRYALEHWDIDGLTTNPRHVQSSGKPFRRILAEIADLFRGTDKPVSVEVDPHLTDADEIIEQGLVLSAMSPNFVVKVGAGESGFRAIRELSRRGVRTNATLIFSSVQAWHAARSGASFVSPFLGWREAHGDEGMPLVRQAVRLVREHGYGTQVLAAAIRNGRHIAQAALAGAHCVTAGFDVYRDSFRNPYTTMGEEVFRKAWDATAQEEEAMVPFRRVGGTGTP